MLVNELIQVKGELDAERRDHKIEERWRKTSDSKYESLMDDYKKLKEYHDTICAAAKEDSLTLVSMRHEIDALRQMENRYSELSIINSQLVSENMMLIKSDDDEIKIRELEAELASLRETSLEINEENELEILERLNALRWARIDALRKTSSTAVEDVEDEERMTA
jgi:hypothetical protein